MKRQIILIGGAPTTGKSTTAKALSKRLHLPWISTDQIRSIMKSVAVEKAHPDLFNGADDAETFLTMFTAQQIADKEFDQGAAVWPGVCSLIDDDSTWRNGFIIEGVNILPHLIASGYADRPDVKAIFLVDHDEDRMRQVVFERGLWADARSYSDELKETEVEWAMIMTRRIAAEAKRYDLPCVDIQKNGQDIDNVLSVLGLAS